MVKIGELGTIYSGGTPSRSNSSYWGRGIKWLAISDYSDFSLVQETKEQITLEGLNNSSAKIFDEGTVIISIFATLGRVAILGDKMATNQAIAGIKCNDSVNNRFLMYSLKSKLKEITDKSEGVAQKNINLNILKNLQVQLPPLNIQEGIVDMLDRARLSSNQSRKIENELNALAQAVFLEMFGDPVSNPLAWPKVSLDEIGEVQGGLQVTSKRASLPVKVDYLRVANVYKNELKLDEVKTIQVTQSELDRTRLKLGDMLVVEGHGNKDEIGRTAVWDGSIEDCTHQNHLIRVRFDGSVAVPEFVSRFLNSEGGRYQINKICNTTSGLNTISANNVRSLEVPLPPIHLQRKFVSFLNALILQISKNLEIQEYNTIIFEALMQRAFSGKLDLKKVA